MENKNYIHSELTEKIIYCFYKVYNKLGYGFLEKVYERALLIELGRAGLSCLNQQRIKVFYDDCEVGTYVPDLLIENKVVVEIKAAISMIESHEDQLRNALKASDLEVGLLLNFGTKPQFRRKVSANEFKGHIKNKKTIP